MTEIDRLAYSPKEVAEMLGVNQATVYRMIHRGEIAAMRLGERTYRVRAVDLEAYLAQATTEEG